MKKLTFLFLSLLVTLNVIVAQNVDEGRRALYYGRFTTAKSTLEKAVAANAKDANAIYWLGQVYLQQSPADLAGARAIYQKALQDGVNAPLVWVGMGHVELLQGNKDAARQRFEAAVTASKTKNKDNPEILNAIGRANADGPSTVGDPVYAIDLLKRAAALDPKNADIQVNLGINYLKKGNENGGDAYEAFTNAQRIDPTNAMANFRLGRIFLSQNNPEKFLEYFNKAVAADAKFAPGYLELYNYYSLRDVNKAREFLDKYVANTDKDCTVDFFSAEYLFRSGKYQESLDKAKAMETGACKDFPRLKVLYAYNYDRLGDSVQAKNNIDAFMNTTAQQNIQPTDYLFAASVSKRVAGGEQAAIGYLTKALVNDTVRANRMQYLDTIAFLYRKTGQHDQRLNYLKQSFQLNPNPSDFDLYNLTDAAILAKQYTLADSLSNVYITRKPDQEYGYALLARAAKAMDVDSTKGTAFPAVEKYIAFLEKDATKNLSKIKSQYYYIASVSADKMKNYPSAIAALEKVQALDPADPFATQALPVLRKAVAGPSRSTTPAKTATKTTTTTKKPAPKKG